MNRREMLRTLALGLVSGPAAVEMLERLNHTRRLFPAWPPETFSFRLNGRIYLKRVIGVVEMTPETAALVGQRREAWEGYMNRELAKADDRLQQRIHDAFVNGTPWGDPAPEYAARLSALPSRPVRDFIDGDWDLPSK